MTPDGPRWFQGATAQVALGSLKQALAVQSGPKWPHVVPDDIRWSQDIRHGPKVIYAVYSGPRWSQMVPGGARWSQAAPSQLA